MDNQQSASMETVESDVIEIIPMGEYDSQKAKLRASLCWILSKAYKDEGVPSEFQDHFYETQEGVFHVKPRLANLLSSSELYCQACCNLFSHSSSQWQGHWSIIQVLSRKGIYIMQSEDVAVTETVLMKTSPFNLSAHLALIDALMKAYISEVVSIEKVVQAVRRFAVFNASSELPSDCTDALLFWINKVCMALQHRLDRQQKAQEQVIEGETRQKVRIVSAAVPRDTPTIPVIDNVLDDISDGCVLASVINFYCPQAIKVEDICLKSNVGIADSLYNLKLVWTFFNTYLPTKCFYMTYEDLLYTHRNMKENIMVLLAEMFYWFETNPLTCVCSPTKEGTEVPKAVGVTNIVGVRLPQVPISNATKQSFQKSADIRASSATACAGAPVPIRQPLLHRRQQNKRNGYEDLHSNISHVSNGGRKSSERETVRQSTLAWQEKEQHKTPERIDILLKEGEESSDGSLLGNVSIDSEMNDSFSGDVTVSINIDLGDSPETERSIESEIPTLLTDVNGYSDRAYEHMELESVTPEGHVTHMSSKTETEPLIPARLKVAKEKVNNHTKAEERGDTVLRRKSESPKERKLISGGSATAYSVSDSVREDIEVVTPLPDEQQYDGTEHSSLSQHETFAAFVIDPMSSGELPIRNLESSTSNDEETKQSYIVDDHLYTVESARAAGIPVISDTADHILPRERVSREGSIASSRSSGDYSDHESHKIHHDHKTRECKEYVDALHETDLSRPGSLNVVTKPLLTTTEHFKQEPDLYKTKSARITNFAEIGTINNSGLIYMQHGQEQNGGQPKKTSLKDTFQQRKENAVPGKKTTFAALPNQTTWQELSGPRQGDDCVAENGMAAEATQSIASELMQIRMKLEEKRKIIERKKHRQELQQVKMRQRLGKAAFLHVVSKPKEETESDSKGSADAIADRRIPMQHQDFSKQTASGSEEMEDLSAAARANRPFSRADIQQTIENVKKKWFKDEELVPSEPQQNETVLNRPVEVSSEAKKRAESPQHIASMPTQTKSLQKIPQMPRDADDKSGSKHDHGPEEYEEYNTSLDKLNKSLTDLQGEIMKMTLQKGGKVLEDGRSKSPKQTTQLEQSRSSVGDTGASTEQGVSQPIRSQPSVSKTTEYGSGKPQASLVDPMSQQPPPTRPAFYLQSHLGQSGQPYTGQNQFIPTCPGMPPQFGGYIMGQQQTYGMQPYNNQPPQLYPQSPSFPQQFPPQPSHMHLTSPSSQPYIPSVMSTGSYQSSSQQYPQQPFQQSHVKVHQQHSHPTLPHHLASTELPHSPMPTTLRHPGAQVYHKQEPMGGSLVSIPQIETSLTRVIPITSQTQSLPWKQFEEPQMHIPSLSETLPEPSGYMPHPQYMETDVADSVKSTPAKVLDDDTSADTSDLDSTPSGFFVSFDDGTPVKPKPKMLGKERVKKELYANYNDCPKSIVASQGPEIVGQPQREIQPKSAVSNRAPADNKADTSTGVEFMIGHEDQNQIVDGEMQKKKEKLMQMQMKRQEEQEKKKQEKEAELNRIREQDRQKQEDSERRKFEEKARREVIFKQYMEKKLEKEEEDSVVERRPSRGKPRPKSMFVRPKAAPTQNNNLTSHGSNDSLSAHGSPGSASPAVRSRLAVPKGRLRKAVSCNTLSQHEMDGKSLLYGGLTHRRPPSPDLLGVRRGKGSNDSSETGSNTGSDYMGPKLFVKPSSKSNRHIIINAVSHCCLAGIVNTDLKNKVLEEVGRADAKHFVILFRDGGCQFKGLYTYDPDIEEILKIYGVGPKQLTNKMIEKYYKYNSGAKTFREVESTKHLSVSIDAVIILGALWKTGKPAPIRH